VLRERTGEGSNCFKVWKDRSFEVESGVLIESLRTKEARVRTLDAVL
jgi:hypothetical protein